MANDISIDPDRTWHCPLLQRTIAEGHCLDINYQRVGLFVPDVVTDVQRETGCAIDEISAICVRWPNQPLARDSDVYR